MNITVVYQHYQGYAAPGHSLMYEMTQALAAQGHNVTVISGESGYMQQDQPTLPWYKRLFRRERDGLVRVIRLFTPANRHKSYWHRLLGFMAFSIFMPLGFMFSRKPAVVLASSPPLFPMVVVVGICKLRRTPLVFEVRDLWPESIVQLGLVRHRWIIALMSWMEKISYNSATSIVALTQGIKDNILARGWPAQKLHTITCGINTSELFPDPQGATNIRVKHGWHDREVVLYLGALGEPHQLDVILDAAHQCRRRQTLFVLIGDGLMRPHLHAKISSLRLDNVHLLPAVPKAMVRGYICAADLCIAHLKDIPLFRGAIPSKLLDYMACGRPVLCGIAGEAAHIVEQAGAGRTFPPGDARQLAQITEALLADPDARARMGAAGVAHIRQHFDIRVKQVAMQKLLEAVAERKTAKPDQP